MPLVMLNMMRSCVVACFLAATLTAAAPHSSSGLLTARQSTEKMVFCHFMVRDVQTFSLAQTIGADHSCHPTDWRHR